MYVEMKSGWLIPRFRYDERIVALVKTITGRSYDRSTRTWCIPCCHVAEVFEKLAPIGFSFTGELRTYGNQLLEHRKLCERAKTMAVYNGKLSAVMHPYQRIGAGFLQVAGRALLADQMGLGKTLQSIAACEADKRVLVLCPATNKYGWKEEIEKWEGVHAQVVDGGPADRLADWHSNAKWTIANYELLLRPADLSEMRRGFDVIICDEANRIANGRAKTVMALKTVPALKRFAMTGTPISNRPSDIWSIVDWLHPGLLGTWQQFLDTYAVFDDWGERGKVVGFKDLPKKTVQDISFDLSPAELKVYDAVRSNIMSEGMVGALADIDRASLGEVMVKMMRLKQVTGHTALVGDGAAGSTKLEVLMERLTEAIEGGEKVIVFTQFAEMAKILSAKMKLEQVEHRLIYGDVAHEDRQRFVNEFNDPSKDVWVMIMTEAGAYGLNLQAASVVVHFDLPWSIAKTLQREDRAHRMGQTKPVTILNLVARGTIDEYVAKVLKRKNRESVEILEDDVRLEEAGLSAEDIKAILRI